MESSNGTGEPLCNVKKAKYKNRQPNHPKHTEPGLFQLKYQDNTTSFSVHYRISNTMNKTNEKS